MKSNEPLASATSRCSRVSSRMRGSSSATRRGVNPRDTSPRMRPCIGGSMARNDIVRWAWGPDADGSSDTPWADEKRTLSRNALHHVGVAGQRPEAALVVAVHGRLVAQALVGGVRVLVDLVLVRAVDEVGRGHRPAPPSEQAGDLVHAVGEVGVAEVAHARLQQRAGQRQVERPEHGRVGVLAERRGQVLVEGRADAVAQALHVGVGREDRGGGRRGQLGLVGDEQGELAQRRSRPGCGRCAGRRPARLARVCSRRQNTSATRWSFDAKYV